MSTGETFDIAIIGGGINGCGIARDAVGRGLSVLLCEKGDLASGTSSTSTKLIHGGLRYLEYYEFRLVRESLKEREVLLRAAPHIIWPLRFVLPHLKGLRPAWMIRIGLFMYDHLGGRELLPGSYGIDLRRHEAGAPLKPGFNKAFVYSDCWVQDSRLVALTAMDAAERGAEILTRTECLSARREDDHWSLVLRDADSGEDQTVRARVLVNAAGPWVSSVLENRISVNRTQSLRLVKGSHIVVPRLFDHDQAYIFQNEDRRIVFAIPYERDFTLVGTTEEDFEGSLDGVGISANETAYLCESINAYFERQISPGDVVWSYAGVRPLFDDDSKSKSAVTRDYVLDLDPGPDGKAALLNVFGGKLTTYRKLAEQVMEKLQPYLEFDPSGWTASAHLPGGDIPDADFDGFLNRVRAAHPWLPDDVAWRLARNYGTRIEAILGGAKSMEELGQDFGGGFTEAEAIYLMEKEWARTADDMMWRRSKMGLHTEPETQARLAQWLTSRDSRPVTQKVPAQ